jgi:hypothetical protein
MSKSLALSVAFIVTASSAALAQAIFDSPGRGYRQQRDQSVPTELRAPGVGGPQIERISPSHLFLKTHDAAFRQLAEDLKNPGEPKLETIALFSSGKKGAAETIRRTLTNAGIPCLVTSSSVVKVDPSRVAEAKTLLKKLAAESTGNLRTVTVAGDQIIFDGGE